MTDWPAAAFITLYADLARERSGQTADVAQAAIAGAHAVHVLQVVPPK